MSKISIIVPVYKVEKYLNRCLDSIIAQTFTDFIYRVAISEQLIEYNEIIHYKGNAFYFNESGFIKKETHQEIIDVGNDNEESSQVPTKEE